MRRYEDNNFGQVWAVLIAIVMAAWIFYVFWSSI